MNVFPMMRRNFTKVNFENISDKEAIITADGSYKLAVVFNDQLPGPPIVVYRGQQVISIFYTLKVFELQIHNVGIK